MFCFFLLSWLIINKSKEFIKTVYLLPGFHKVKKKHYRQRIIFSSWIATGLIYGHLFLDVL